MPAYADEIPVKKSFVMAVEGSIPQHCAMGSIPNLALGDLESAARSRSTDVALDCNMPIDVTVSATNGAIANTAYPQGQGPYAGKLPYRLGFAVPTRTPAQGLVQQTFDSADLVGGRTFSSNGGIAIDGMRLTIDLPPVSKGDGALLGGDYSETIEITVTAS
jgi:hypothetical protein